MAAENHQASYDVLAIVGRLQGAMNGVTVPEIHLLAYLACLLALYRGYPAGSWEYRFVRSDWGSPFSQEVQCAIATLEDRQFLVRDVEAMHLTANGREFWTFLAERHEHAWRTSALDGACSSALTIPAGVIRQAIHGEPSLRTASIHQSTRMLLDTGDIALLHHHFTALSEAVGPNVADLIVPSVVWLRYLVQVQKREYEKKSLIAASAPTMRPVSEGKRLTPVGRRRTRGGNA